MLVDCGNQFTISKVDIGLISAAAVLEWSTDEVGQWLQSMDLDDYRDTFATHDIRGRELLSLGRTDLKVRCFTLSVVSQYVSNDQFILPTA